MAQSNWHPSWWKNEEHGTAWERVKEAVRRDWEQTRHDLNVGGHELNQGIKDTVKQASGSDAIPMNDKANPPKVIGNWDDVEMPLGYGYGARRQYGKQHTAWDNDVEASLQSEWELGKAETKRPWNEVKDVVRRGYEFKN
jgi:hypothetical protein